jgi:type I restriction enzyme M protein
VVLFFEKGSPTSKVWYYQLDPGRNLGKTNPLNDADLSEFIELQKSFADSDHSWSLDVNDVDDATCDLSVKNPNRDDEVELRQPDAILEEIASLDAESANILNNIKTLVGS